MKNKLLLLVILGGWSQLLWAEPYLAAGSGFKCAMCHVSPTGGGMRTEFGQAFGRSLAASEQAVSKLDPQLSDGIRIGADLRASLRSVKTPGQADLSDFDTDRASVYLAAELLPQTLMLYLDQQFSPASDSREAWVKYQATPSLYVRAGKFFLPFGLRLEDDSAFVRQVSGINFLTADNGIELGFDKDAWNAQLAISNGTAGAAETNDDKQISLRGAYIRPLWRVGASVNSNQSLTVEQDMIGLFATANLFSATWLIEFDQIDSKQQGTVTQEVFLAEVNKVIKKGHNIKLTLESHDPNTDVEEDERTRNSLVWEYFPVQQLQLRTGFRLGDGIPQKPQDNVEELFFNLHAWF